MKNKHKLLLLVIFLFSFFVRFYQVGNYPPLLWDEAAIGYNAYSLLQTGKDEYGKIFPLIFKSFGDYKPGFYVYLTLPFIKIFGLNSLATRLPSVIFGSLLPIVIYFLIKEINQKAHKTALLASLMLAFNPYSIHFSRSAWESNILTFQLVLASYFFFKYINKRVNLYLFISSLIFGLTLYTYQAGKLISLFLIIILLITNRNSLSLKNLKNIILNFILPLFIFTLPVFYGLFFSNNANRLKVVSLFSYSRSEVETSQIIKESNSFDYQLFHHQSLFFLRNFFTRYFNHFSPKFLAFEGDWQNSRHGAPYVGVMLYPNLIFFFFGFFYALSRLKIDKLNVFFLLWLFVAPLPSAFTRDTIQSLRSLSFSLPLIYFSSLGLYIFLKKYQNILLSTIIFLAYFLSFIYYADLYLNHFIKKAPQDSLYGYQAAIQYVIENKNNYDQILFTNYYGQPYIYYLFYSKYPPQQYQQQAKLTENDQGDVGSVNQIDNVKFKPISLQEDVDNKTSILAIFSYSEVLEQVINHQKDFSAFIPLSPINNISTFYAYQKK